jgi:hypothetical protein
MKREENIRKSGDRRSKTRVQGSEFKVQSLKFKESEFCNPELAAIKRNSTVFCNNIPVEGKIQYAQLVFACAVFNN